MQNHSERYCSRFYLLLMWSENFSNFSMMLKGISSLTGCRRIIAVKVLEGNNLSEGVANLQIFSSDDLKEDKVTKRGDRNAVSDIALRLIPPNTLAVAVADEVEHRSIAKAAVMMSLFHRRRDGEDSSASDDVLDEESVCRQVTDEEHASDGDVTGDDPNDAVEEEVIPAVAQLDEGEFSCTVSRPHYNRNGLESVTAHWVDMEIPVAFLSRRDQTAMGNASRRVRVIRRHEQREAALAQEEDN
ncbi:hypothetical protein PHYPSEUDO_006440 [Phytophthora pseudosyringae]|uniref:Uncharacterized protein n=1 Tax=Phytophthora pseudosyringae TaxID=221518 RepID=A0A8T1VP26_9STRA|nr:hypothetical protein PHYPSEUDO_006440 [Phytophthora pseudosyringae]